MVSNRLTVINGVLAQFAMTPVATVDQNDTAKVIDQELDRYLPLFEKVTLDWSSLTKVVTLDTPLVTSLSQDWQFTFALPFDYIRILKVFNGLSFDVRFPYIFSNAETMELKYIYAGEDYSSFEPHFLNYFIFFVASHLVAPLTRDSALAKSIDNLFRVAKEQAEVTELRLKSGINTLINPRSKMVLRSL